MAQQKLSVVTSLQGNRLLNSYQDCKSLLRYPVASYIHDVGNQGWWQMFLNLFSAVVWSVRQRWPACLFQFYTSLWEKYRALSVPQHWRMSVDVGKIQKRDSYFFSLRRREGQGPFERALIAEIQFHIIIFFGFLNKLMR